MRRAVEIPRVAGPGAGPLAAGRALAFALALTLGAGAQAQGVEFGAVDAATVRAFAVQNVTTEEGRTARGTRVVAIPNMGHGTGFSVTGGDHLVLTAAHVVENALYVVVRLPGDGAYYPARVAYRDDERDVAVLHIVGDVPPLELQPADHTLRTRQQVFTVGYPLDASRRQAQSSRGIVGGARDDGQVQLDMDVNPGNSGGPVIDEADRVVGMLVAGGDVRQGVQGLALAVPLATLHDALREARLRLVEARVPGLPGDADEAARVIDTLSRVGLMRVLREASDVTEGTTDTQAIQEIRALDLPELSPDMKVFVAAFLWDAAQMLMFRAGDHVSPGTMPVGPTRTLAEELLQQASTLMRAAAQRDPTISDRSPFVRVVTGGGPALVSSEALRPFVDAFPLETAPPLPEVPPENWHWRDRQSWLILAGLGAGGGGLIGGTGGGGYALVHPLTPGAVVRFFGGIRLTPAAVFSLVVEVDLLITTKMDANYRSEPSTFDEVRSRGGGGTFLLRFHPGGAGFFIAPSFRVGGQRFRDKVYDSSTRTYRTRTETFRLIQPGLEVGFQLAHSDLSLRGHIGVPSADRSAGLYTIMLNLAFHIFGGGQ